MWESLPRGAAKSDVKIQSPYQQHLSVGTQHAGGLIGHRVQRPVSIDLMWGSLQCHTMAVQQIFVRGILYFFALWDPVGFALQWQCGSEVSHKDESADPLRSSGEAWCVMIALSFFVFFSSAQF